MWKVTFSEEVFQPLAGMRRGCDHCGIILKLAYHSLLKGVVLAAVLCFKVMCYCTYAFVCL